MGQVSTESVTRLLRKWRAGDEVAKNELAVLIYDELRRLARREMRRDRLAQTLQASASRRPPFQTSSPGISTT